MIKHQCFLLFLLGFAFHAFAAQLVAVEVHQNNGIWLVDCLLQGQFSERIFVLDKPDRLVVDLKDTTTMIHPDSLRFDPSMFSKLRMGKSNPKELRVVFDLNRPVRLKRPWIKRYLGNRQQIHLELAEKYPRSVSYHPKPNPVNQKTVILKKNQDLKIKTNPAPSPNPSKPLLIHQSPTKAQRDIVVVIDAGHGGKDPGAKGPRKSEEKSVVLAIATQLKALIDQQSGMRAVLTRRGDYYLPLRQRLKIARLFNADLFVSIHADAFLNQASNGASVFALSPTGATSEAARWLAEKENYSELGGVDLSELHDKSGLIRTVLIDLSQTATINSSLRIGNKILNQMQKITNLHTGKVEQARFVVLKSLDIPSVLIETGFISNPHEEYNLSNPIYQSKLTHAIEAGIKAYFLEYPPHGSRLEAQINRQLVLKK